MNLTKTLHGETPIVKKVAQTIFRLCKNFYIRKLTEYASRIAQKTFENIKASLTLHASKLNTYLHLIFTFSPSTSMSTWYSTESIVPPAVFVCLSPTELPTSVIHVCIQFEPARYKIWNMINYRSFLVNFSKPPASLKFPTEYVSISH